MNNRSKLPDYYFDVRVRDRLVASGVLDPKVLEQHVAELADVESQCESIGIDQPALSPRDNE